MLYGFRDKSGKKNGNYLLCVACADVGWGNYICKEIEACKTSNYIRKKSFATTELQSFPKQGNMKWNLKMSALPMIKKRYSTNEVYEAAKKARCYDFIMALPDGFQTVVGEGGASLSGGEKQRISIARCILKDAPIVILDEATASVDADNESYIQQAISELCEGKTLIVIAHRLGTIRNADKILVIKDGQISEEGTHNSLMEQNGIYRSFVTMRESSVGWNNRAMMQGD